MLLRPTLPPAAVSGRTIEVPVAYGGDAGPDLEDVAAYAGLSSEQVTARHSSVDYRVYMLGFLPGFAYMGLVPPEIATTGGGGGDASSQETAGTRAGVR